MPGCGIELAVVSAAGATAGALWAEAVSCSAPHANTNTTARSRAPARTATFEGVGSGSVTRRSVLTWLLPVCDEPRIAAAGNWVTRRWPLRSVAAAGEANTGRRVARAGVGA